MEKIILKNKNIQDILNLLYNLQGSDRIGEMELTILSKLVTRFKDYNKKQSDIELDVTDIKSISNELLMLNATGRLGSFEEFLLKNILKLLNES